MQSDIIVRRVIIRARIGGELIAEDVANY